MNELFVVLFELFFTSQMHRAIRIRIKICLIDREVSEQRERKRNRQIETYRKMNSKKRNVSFNSCIHSAAVVVVAVD